MRFPASRGLRRAAFALGGVGLAVSVACQSPTGGALAGAAPEAAASQPPATQGPIAGGATDAEAGGAGATVGPAGDLLAGYLDDQAKNLRDGVPDAEVERQEDRLLVTLPGDVIFAAGSASLSPGGSQRLDSIARTLLDHPDTDVVVKGYTDASGSEAFNLELSEERASHVRSYLATQGVARGRLKSVGFGPQFPVATNDTPEGRQRNRRVELELTPNQSLRERAAESTAR